jgi:DNA-binding NarL/FixJ family response regulator
MTLRIVLADDHSAYRAYLRTLLDEEPDMTVAAEAEDGEGAVCAVREQKPDIVILDLAMPNLDGIQATRQIVALQPEARVLALSLHSDRIFVEAMAAAGAAGYMLKTDPFPELLRAIREVAAGYSFISTTLTGGTDPMPATGGLFTEGDDGDPQAE